MKKNLSYALLLLALPFAVTSCSDEDDLPDVDYTISISGGVFDQDAGTIYVVQGDTLRIDALNVVNLDSDKAASITGAEYFWDYGFIGSSPLPPYGFNIYVSDTTPLGNHTLSIRTGVVAVDKEPAFGIVAYTVKVVASADDIPSSATSQSNTASPGMKMK